MKKTVLRILSYLLVAALAATAAFGISAMNAPEGGKLQELENLIEARFIGDSDPTKMEDAAAAAMVGALGDRWSYYIPAADYAAYQEQMNNSYVGVGITITALDNGNGLRIIQVQQNGPAAEAGIRAEDVLIAVDGVSIAGKTMSEVRNLISGSEGARVRLTVLRDGEQLELTVEHRSIQTVVASGQMLEDGIGLIKIANFDARCADETIAAIQELVGQGASALIFDVRFNPGGYKQELVRVLDYLLPEGELFRSEDYAGRQNIDYSDADCLELPMVVLVNGESYSAAEFFAAALREYEVAQVVGQQTCGKGFFQSTFRLQDGSAVGLSIGKYYTPKGVSLADVGITPDQVVEVSAEQMIQISAGLLKAEDDPQIQAALLALKGAK